MRRILSVTVLLAVLTACSPFDEMQPDEYALANADYAAIAASMMATAIPASA